MAPFPQRAGAVPLPINGLKMDTHKYSLKYPLKHENLDFVQGSNGDTDDST